MSIAPLLDEVCERCSALLRDMGDEMRCVGCYPFTYSEEEAEMHSILEPWLKRQIESHPDGLNLHDLARDAATHFLADEVFIQRTVAALVQAAAREEAQRILRAKRGGPTVLLGDQVVSRADLEKRARSSQLWGWLETVGERKIRLYDMTRDDLLEAASERTLRGRRELLIAAFWNRLAKDLGAGQTIGTRFSAEEIERFTTERASLDNPKQPLALRDGHA